MLRSREKLLFTWTSRIHREFIEKQIARKMLKMYEQWKAGLPLIDHTTLRTGSRIASAFSMLLNGATDNEMKEKNCTEMEIEKAREFLTKYAKADMLPVMISQETGIAKSTIRKMMKLYRERQAQDAGLISWKDPHVGIATVSRD